LARLLAWLFQIVELFLSSPINLVYRTEINFMYKRASSVSYYPLRKKLDTWNEGRDMRFGLALLGVATTALWVSSASATLRITGDAGGQIGPYLQNLAAVRNSGERVVIDGPCLSACTLVLGVIPRDRICVTSRALLGFHA